MEFIAHRVNEPDKLSALDTRYGIEVDLRDDGQDLICRHDPFGTGPQFEALCAEYRHGTMVLNIKSERIEEKVISILQKYNIKQYFFLDSSMPMVVKLTQAGVSQVALRFSDYESIETIMRFAGKAQWVWVDAFEQLTLTYEQAQQLHQAGFKLCLVSPELQGQPDKLTQYAAYLADNKIRLDAICAKLDMIALWKPSYLVATQTHYSDIMN